MDIHFHIFGIGYAPLYGYKFFGFFYKKIIYRADTYILILILLLDAERPARREGAEPHHEIYYFTSSRDILFA